MDTYVEDAQVADEVKGSQQQKQQSKQQQQALAARPPNARTAVAEVVASVPIPAILVATVVKVRCGCAKGF